MTATLFCISVMLRIADWSRHIGCGHQTFSLFPIAKHLMRNGIAITSAGCPTIIVGQPTVPVLSGVGKTVMNMIKISYDKYLFNRPMISLSAYESNNRFSTIITSDRDKQ